MPKVTKDPLPDLGYIAETMRGSQPGTALDGARSLPLDVIDPNPAQSRQVFDELALHELADSIRAHGVLEPILVRPVGERYQVVAGERRVRAAKAAGLADIPAIIREMDDQAAAYVTAVENLQRADLDIEDEARWLSYLQTLTGESQRDLAKRIGKSHEYISKRIRLLTRPDLMAHVRTGALSQTAALAALVEQERLNETMAELSTELTAGADSTPVEEPPRRAVERADLDQYVPAPGQYFRYVDTAMKALDKIRPLIIAPSERPLWAQQLAELEDRARELRQSMED